MKDFDHKILMRIGIQQIMLNKWKRMTYDQKLAYAKNTCMKIKEYVSGNIVLPDIPPIRKVNISTPSAGGGKSKINIRKCPKNPTKDLMG